MSVPDPGASERPGLSLVVPIYRNEENIADLMVVLDDLHARHGDRFEAVLVVDGSPDRSYQLLHAALADRPMPSQLILLARNFGSFLAIRRGLEAARNEITTVMAADLQEPPELVDRFYDELSAGDADLAVGVRERRSDGWLSTMLSNLYWWLFRRAVFPDVPQGGVDVFGCNAKVRTTLLDLREHNTSLIGQLFWVGFRRVEVTYVRRPREKGSSGWSLRRRFRYMLDSFFAFSDLPIMMLIWLGVVGVALSILGAITVLVFWSLGRIDAPGYTATILTVLFVGSVLISGQGIVGAYVWRASENSKRRPLSVTSRHEHFGWTSDSDQDGDDDEY